MLNLISDVPGLKVGHAPDVNLASGVTVVVFDTPAVASVAIQGGAPGARETALLDPEATVERVDALVLSGGSAFGLDAAGGAMAHLRQIGRGFAVGNVRVPIVPSAVIFDLGLGGATDWSNDSPWWHLGRSASSSASTSFSLGTAGAGYGATTANFKGGLGSASAKTRDGFLVGAIVVVNAVGTVVPGEGPKFWAGLDERDGEFGAHGAPTEVGLGERLQQIKKEASSLSNTTIGIVATDAVLTKAEARRVSVMAHDGIARAIRPSHAPLDGDLVFAAATGVAGRAPDIQQLSNIGDVAAQCLARAIARGVYEAVALPFSGSPPAFRDRFRN
jgi:D-aminopeptidase